MKYGFVYLWYDKKRKKFYLGRHWGTEDDGYICSSRKMKDAYYYRPQDFKRRIIKRVDNKEQLVVEEQRYLNMIKPEERNKKYYNVTLKANGPSMIGRKHSPETIEKIRSSNKGLKRSEETKQKLREANAKQFADPKQRLSRSEKIKSLWEDPKYREKQTKNKIGYKQSQQTKDKRAEKVKQHWKTHTKPGNVWSGQSKQKLSEHFSKTKWFNNGLINKRCIEQPKGFNLGRI